MQSFNLGECEEAPQGPGSVPAPSNMSCFPLLPETIIFTRVENRRKCEELQAAKRGQLLRKEAWDPKMWTKLPVTDGAANRKYCYFIWQEAFYHRELLQGRWADGRAFLYVPL